MGYSETEKAHLEKLCVKLGASEVQANVMARQLLKRADQMAEEKGIVREEAMDYLLKVMICGRRGEVFQGNVGDAGQNSS